LDRLSVNCHPTNSRCPRKLHRSLGRSVLINLTKRSKATLFKWYLGVNAERLQIRVASKLMEHVRSICNKDTECHIDIFLNLVFRVSIEAFKQRKVVLVPHTKGAINRVPMLQRSAYINNRSGFYFPSNLIQNEMDSIWKSEWSKAIRYIHELRTIICIV